MVEETLSEEGGGDDGEMKTQGESSNQDEDEGKKIDYSPSAPPYFTIRRPHKSNDSDSSGLTAETHLLASYHQLNGERFLIHIGRLLMR